MSKIRYVFWDSDNTLFNTFALHWAKHVHVLNAYGIVLDEEYKPRIHHNNGGQNWEWLTAELGLKVSRDDYLSQIDAYYVAHAGGIKMRDGVQEALDLFRDKGLRQCVVSNGRRSSVMPAHEALRTQKYFDFILCKEDYEGRKPDPAPYASAANRMAKGGPFLLNECLAIEDDPLGVESAKRAGMVTIFRPTPLVAQTSFYADYTVTTTDEFLDAVRQQVVAD